MGNDGVYGLFFYLNSGQRALNHLSFFFYFFIFLLFGKNLNKNYNKLKILNFSHKFCKGVLLRNLFGKVGGQTDVTHEHEKRIALDKKMTLKFFLHFSLE